MATVDFEVYDSRTLQQRVYGNRSNTTDDQLICTLPHLDYWDPTIRKKMQVPGPVSPKCQPYLEQMSSLINGVLRIHWEPRFFTFFPPTCFYRCLHPVNDAEMKVDDWTKIEISRNATPGCDIVEVYCRRHFNPHYSFIHTQIVEKQPAKNGKGFSLYWIVLDTISTSMFKRGLPKTLRVLEEKFQAVEFPFLSKAGVNSRPNAYAMFFGFKDNDTLCETPLDNTDFVGYDFQNAGYYTEQTEDWSIGTLNWPSCVGFKKRQADHFMRPFWFKVDHKSKSYNWNLKNHLMDRLCRLGHHYVMEHLVQFAGAYPGKPKFSTNWMVELAHDDNIKLFGADDDFAQYFEELHEKARDSFVFFQSDHGKRWGRVRNIPIIGEVEDNNPFLFVSVPERLRQNPSLMKRVQENAQNLVAHFDLYASAVQVAKFSHEWDEATQFDQPPPKIPNRNFIGSSLFHQIKQPRTCESLEIFPHHCICSQDPVPLNDTKLSVQVAQFLVDSINQRLESSPVKDLCQKHSLSLKYPVQLEELRPKEKGTRILRARFMTLPGGAQYQGAVQLHSNQTMSLMYKDFTRLDSYARQAKCIPEQFLRNYCVCY